MDRRTVLTKTAKGLMEVTGKTSLLSRDQRNLLVHVDGKATVGDLQRGKLSESKLQLALAALIRDGFVREFVSAPHSVSPPSQLYTRHDLDFTELVSQDKAEEEALQAAEAAEIARAMQAKAAPPPKAKETPAPDPRREAIAQAKREAEEGARREAEAQAKREAEEKARREAEAKAKREAEEKARREAEAQAKREAEEKARREAEAKAKHEAEEKARREAEQKAKREAEEKARREAEAKAKREAEEKARREAEAKAKREAEEKARREAEAKAKREAEEKARREAEAKAKREAEEKARREAEAKAKREAEEKARREAEAQAKREAEEKARREAEAKAKREAEEKARREAEAKAKREAEEKARREAEAAARREAEEKAQQEAAAKARRKAEEAARRAEEKARREAEARERKEAKARAAAQAAEIARLEADAKAQRRAAEQAEKARRDWEEKADKERLEQMQRAADEQQARAAEHEAKQRQLDEERTRARAEAERAASERREQRAREKAESDARAAARKRERERDLALIGARLRRIRGNNAGGVKKWLGGGVALLLIVGALGAPYWPIDPAPYERMASETLGVPVKIGKASYAWSPWPAMKFAGVTLGAQDETRIDSLLAVPTVWTMLSEQPELRQLRLDGVALKPAALPMVLARKFDVAIPALAQIDVHGVRLDTPGVTLPALHGRIELRGGKSPGTVQLQDDAGHLTMQVVPQGGGSGSFELELTDAAAIVGFALTDFYAKGTLTATQADVTAFDGRLYDGLMKGQGVLTWSPLSFNGALEANLLTSVKIAPALEGRLSARGNLAMQAETFDALFAKPTMNGSFEVAQGVVHGLDLPRSLQAGEAAAGSTAFEELSGKLALKDGRLRLSDLSLRAGVMTASGSADLAGGKQLDGHIAAQLRIPAGYARANFAIGGTPQALTVKR